MNTLTPFFDALAVRIMTILPETDPANGGGGIWREGEIAREPFQEACKAGQLPIVAVGWKITADDSGRYGLTRRTLIGPVVVYYSVHKDNDLSTIEERMETLKEGFWPASNLRVIGDNAQLAGEPWPDMGLDLPPNYYFITSNMPLYCGALRFNVVVQKPYP